MYLQHSTQVLWPASHLQHGVLAGLDGELLPNPGVGKREAQLSVLDEAIQGHHPLLW